MRNCTQFIKLSKVALSVWDKDNKDANLGKNQQGNLSIAVYIYFIFLTFFNRIC